MDKEDNIFELIAEECYYDDKWLEEREEKRMNQDLIVVEQLPVITEKLNEVAKAIDEKVEYAKKLICTEENKQSIKTTRAEMKKEFEEFEKQRKAVKEAVTLPYLRFEEVYKQCISDKFKNADADLKEKIDAIEIEQKQRIENGAKEFFEEYKAEKKIDFVKFEQMNLKIGLSDNQTKLKKVITAFLDKVSEDLQLIEIQDHKAEILVEYKQSLNVNNAITTVVARVKAIEDEKKKQEEFLKEAAKAEIVPEKKVEFEVANDQFQIVPEKKKIILEITAEEKQILDVVDYLKLKNINYEVL
jgi:hypothetical protein